MEPAPEIEERSGGEIDEIGSRDRRDPDEIE
jgi:hypothetical protein